MAVDPHHKCNSEQGLGSIGHSQVVARFQRMCSARAIVENLPSAFEHKFEKVGLSRWFHYVESVKQLLAVWSQRLALLQYLTVQLGN